MRHVADRIQLRRDFRRMPDAPQIGERLFQSVRSAAVRHIKTKFSLKDLVRTDKAVARYAEGIDGAVRVIEKAWEEKNQ